VNDAYLITLGTLILAAGSLSDIFGRKRILTLGLYGFLVFSLLCALAPTGTFLIVARGLQGIAGALLVPSSLAMIISVFKGPEQSKAIGTWTGWTGIAFIVGPLVGGLMVQLATWRLVFAINLIPIAIALIMLRQVHFNESFKTKKRIDVQGIILGAIGLGGVVYALIEQAHYHWSSPLIYGTFIVGVAALIGFIFQERRSAQPMLPLELFQTRNFSIGNVATFLIYGALSMQGFILVIFLQQVAHYSAVMAGLSSIPITILLFILSPRFGALAGKFGPRLFMALGPITAGIGVLLMMRIDQQANYITELLPGIIFFGIGMSATVSPLTSAILGSIKPTQAGIGSAVNNAVSRIAGLLAIATIGVVIGESVTLNGFHRLLLLTATLLVVGGIVSAIGIQNKTPLKISKNSN
jgi:EmrB/QacA subfamily drug resistance transporter